MKHKILLFAMMALALACAGCGQDAGGNGSQTGTGGDPAYGNNGQDTGNNGSQSGTGENPSNADELFEISDLNGAVYEFTENGCTVSPTKEGGEGEAIQAAPGYEDTFVSVVYDPGCTFWIAHVDIQTATATYEMAAAEDVKKQTSLIICGEYDENDVLHASRVFLYRTEGM